MTWKFKQIKPQKARGKYVESLWSDPQWLVEEKYDGERRIAQFCGNIIRFTGCRESVDGTGFVEKTGQIPQLSNAPFHGSWWKMPKIAHLDGTVLDGEVLPPPGTEIKGGGSKYVTSVMGSSQLEAIRKQRERGYLIYKVFDCLFYKGVDVRSQPLVTRRTFMTRAVQEWKNEYVSVSLAYAGGQGQEIYKRAAEGVVFKHVAHTYSDEKLWVKHKKAWTADVVVMGFTQGKGKYLGQIGAIEFGQWEGTTLRGVGQCSGMDDTLRNLLSKGKHTFTGQVIEITHNGREPSGKFRHPQFSRFRPDKSPKDCIYDQEET